MQIKQKLKKIILTTLLLTIVAGVPIFSLAVTPQKEQEIKSFINDNKNLFFAGDVEKVDIKKVEEDDGLFKTTIEVGAEEYPFYLTHSFKIVPQFVEISKISKGEESQLGDFDAQAKKIILNDKFKENIKDFVEKYLLQTPTEVTVGEVKEDDGLYEITITAQGKDQPIYLALDGKKMAFGIKSLSEYKKMAEERKKRAEVHEQNKTDKPKVDLFVMSYCPYGTQIEKGILPVLRTLEGKIDAKIRFVDYAMHDKKEIDENLLQHCIQENAPDKLYDYLDCFLKDGQSDKCLKDVGLTKKDEGDKNDKEGKKKSFWNKIIGSLKSIFGKGDKTPIEKIEKCVKETDTKFKISENYKDKSTWQGRFPGFDIDKDDNKKYGVEGSPTLIINGQKIQPNGRDAQSLLESICSGFKNPPKECEQKLSSDQPSPGFGSGIGNSSGGGCGQ